jgi:anti-sigma factor RsiW
VSHAEFDTLLAYWLGELDDASEAALEEHYLGCAECSARLGDVEALADGIQRTYAAGYVGTVVTPAFVERLRARGLRLREYRVPRDGSVNCSVWPEDQLLFSRLQVPLEGVERVDLIVSYDGEHRLEDVAFDAASGEVVMAAPIARVRELPAHRRVIRVIAVTGGTDHLLGEYTFNHTPHAG